LAICTRAHADLDPGDSVASLRFAILHFRDIGNTISPPTLPNRLLTAGFRDVEFDFLGRQATLARRQGVERRHAHCVD
jgi:hypothetical protein